MLPSSNRVEVRESRSLGQFNGRHRGQVRLPALFPFCLSLRNLIRSGSAARTVHTLPAPEFANWSHHAQGTKFTVRNTVFVSSTGPTDFDMRCCDRSFDAFITAVTCNAPRKFLSGMQGSATSPTSCRCGHSPLWKRKTDIPQIDLILPRIAVRCRSPLHRQHRGPRLISKERCV